MENLPFAHVGSQRALNSIILKYREESETSIATKESRERKETQTQKKIKRM
jgi:hypothetical protein